MEWYYSDNGEQQGPSGDQEFASLVEDGTITGETLVWNETMSEWRAYATLQDAPPADQQSPIADQHVCSECGEVCALDALVELGGRLICGQCKPVVVQKFREGAASLGGMHYAGFWIRVLAKVIDLVILGVVNMLIQAVFTVGAGAFVGVSGAVPVFGLALLFMVFVQMAAQLCVAVAFTTFFLGKFGATPGKMACGLKVVRSDGSPLSYKRACARHFADMINQFTFFLLYLMVAFDEERRGVHDRICDTRVVRRDAKGVDEVTEAYEPRCLNCGTLIPREVWNNPEPQHCPQCNRLTGIDAFPALLAPASKSTASERLIANDEASCFYHSGKKAEVVCDSCGRFLCALCDIEIGDAHTCPQCLNAPARKTPETHILSEALLYDKIALQLAVMPMLLVFTIYFTFMTAPACLFVVIRYWSRMKSVVPRTRWRFVVAAVIAILQLLGWGALAIAIVVAIFS